MEGVKYDGEKPRWCLVPLDALEDMVKVLTFGAKKYADDNWKKVPDAENRYMSALLRHITAYQRGEATDQESGLSHIAHAQCCLLFISWFEKHKGETNDTSNT